MLTMLFSTLAFVTLFPAAFAKVQFLGVAIAGGDFGCQIDGTCPPGSAQLPLSNGPTQMSHFVKDDGINLLRLPTSWQFLVNSQLGGDLDASNFSKYNQLVQACLATGAYCMIDIHNFARWNGQIIGQGGPTDEQFASFWGQLAGKYASSEKIVFEIMNEPHDLDIGIWAQTCQKVVTAIREAGATSQMILLPGTNFDSAATLVSSGSADALFAVTNPDGSTDNLLLDIHKYLDEDNSGTHATCTTNNIDAFTTIAQYLRSKGRKGLISETGASSDASCAERQPDLDHIYTDISRNKLGVYVLHDDPHHHIHSALDTDGNNNPVIEFPSKQQHQGFRSDHQLGRIDPDGFFTGDNHVDARHCYRNATFGFWSQRPDHG
ncbi:hypothetical protein ONZ43_g6280 [Nemania bipapillata]|uniref:Uncharacterized protein n=1 Tax=Nemania bipapillata TaxID=110536 RepID=A0ACC2I2C3_9PEZI|nr:hypothetical protein ONZ43_g6280 [Nemania bipapillata]